MHPFLELAVVGAAFAAVVREALIPRVYPRARPWDFEVDG